MPRQVRTTSTRSVLDVLAEAGEPPFNLVSPPRISERTRADWPLDRLEVYGHTIEIRPPVDWRQDPLGQRSWRYRLHTLGFVQLLIGIDRERNSREVIGKAMAIVLDWIRANPRDGEDISEFAWYDMGVGLRAPVIGYVLRIAALRGVLVENDAQVVLESLVEHGEFLADDANYAHGHNHGLFQDEGLLLLCTQVPFVEQVDDWRSRALVRLKETLHRTVSLADAVHLEHSPAYHFAVVNILTRLAGEQLLDAELAELAERMKRSARWLVLPDRTLPSVGDTPPRRPVPAWAYWGDRPPGLAAMPAAGFAAVRDGDSYMLMSCGHHSAAHKQADELSFVLVDTAEPVVIDPGVFAYDERDPNRIYARSSGAHNVLLVDGQDFDWREQAPYGSALDAWGGRGGWYAIEAHNPLLGGVGVEHRRRLLFAPRRVLVILDLVRSPQRHSYARRLHLAPPIAVKHRAGGLVLGLPDGRLAKLSDHSPSAVDITVSRGVDEDGHMTGWAFGAERTREPTTTVELTATAADATFAMAIGLREGIAVTGVAWDGGSSRVDLTEDGVGSTVWCERSASSLAVDPEQGVPVGHGPPEH